MYVRRQDTPPQRPAGASVVCRKPPPRRALLRPDRAQRGAPRAPHVTTAAMSRINGRFAGQGQEHELQRSVKEPV